MGNKRILFITHDPFSTVGSNGKTYLSLFSEFKDAEVAQLFFNGLEPTTRQFSNFFKLTDKDAVRHLLGGRKISGNFSKGEVTDSIKPAFGKRSLLKSELIKIVRNFIFSLLKIEKIPALDEWVRSFSPTVIFSIGTNYNYQYEAVKKLSEKYGISYFIYFTDDYFIYNKGNNFATKIIHDRFVSKSKKIIEGAEELFVISPKMKAEYEAYFSKTCTILINASKKKASNFRQPTGTEIVFRYFGWLHSNRASSLGYLGKCLKYINEHHPFNCKLEIFSLSVVEGESEQSLNVDTIHIQQPVGGSDYFKKIDTSDFLVHAESFEPKDTQVTMLSISTKIPEYLSSGRCVVAVGPSRLASVNIFTENNLGLTITDQSSIPANAEKILKVINDTQLYDSYCKQADQYCSTHFNPDTMRQQLINKLSIS